MLRPSPHPGRTRASLATVVGAILLATLGGGRAGAEDAAQPDLVVRFLDVPSGPLTPGQVFGVGFEVRNRGSAPSSPTVVRLALVRGGAAGGAEDGTATPLDQEPLDAVAAGGVGRGRLRAELRPDLEAGPAVLRLQVGAAGGAESSGPTATLDVEVRGPRPNLIVSGLNAVPGEVWPGETLRLVAIVRNAGDAPAPATVLAFSAVRARPALTVALASAPVPPLAPGEEARVRAEATVPPTMTSGRFGVLAMADADEAVLESDENDNVAVAPGAIAALTEPPGPGDDVDLAVSTLGVDGGTEVLPAAPLRLRLRLANHGRVEAPAFEVAVLLATREQPEWRRDGWLGVVSELARVPVPPGLAAGGASERVLSVRLPAALAPGRWFLYAVVDPSASVREPKRPEDLVAAPVTVRAAPVLAARQGRVDFEPARVAAGAPLVARATLRNDGNVPTKGGSLALVFTSGPGARPDRRPSPTTGFVTKPLPAIAPGDTVEVPFEAVLPEALVRGVYGVSLYAVDEAGAAVALATGRLEVRTPGAGPDLVVADVAVDRPRLRPGEPLVLRARVGNLGDAPAPATEVAFAASLGPSGIVVRELGRRAVPTLAPGAFVDVAFPTRVDPDARPGDVAWRVGVDPEGRVAPSTPANDEAWVTAEVAPRGPLDVAPSLRLVAIDEGPPATPGGTLEVRGVVADVDASTPLLWASVDLEASLVAADGKAAALGRRGLPLPDAKGLAFAERFRVPGDLAPGDYVFRLRLDPDRRLPWREGAAERGVVETPLRVAPPSRPSCDLSVLRVEDEGGPRRGPRQLAVSAMLASRGPGMAPAFSATLYLASGDDERPGLWLPLMSRSFPGGKLAPGVQTKASFALTLNDDVPAGVYRAVVVVDPDLEVDRLARADNAGHVEVRVGRVAVGGAPTAPGGGDVDLVVVDARPATPTAKAGGTLTVRARVATKALGKARTRRFFVYVERADGSWRELWASDAEPVPGVGGHAVSTLAVPLPADLSGRLRLHLQVRADGEGDAHPEDNGADLEVVVEGAAAPEGALPRVVSVEAPGKALLREVVTPLTVVVRHGALGAPWLLELTLEAGGTAYPLGEFDVPPGPVGAEVDVRPRVRIPTTLAPGPSVLILRFLREGSPPLDAGRFPLPIR